jgi:Putative metallopeptidase
MNQAALLSTPRSPLASLPHPWTRALRLTATPLWLWLGALMLVACGDDSGGKPDNGDFTTEWKTGGSPLAQTLRREELFEDLADALNQGLKLPRDLPIIHKSCGEENAFYDPSRGELQMCYELLESISDLSREIAEDDDEYGERVVATWVFVFFHEVGHALIDLYDLPTVGKEEDAVDEFSTLLMIQSDLAEYALYAAEYWQATDTGIVDETLFADEHSLNSQRFYNILCLVYGSDPDRYDAIVSLGFLPESRAARCPSEYAQKDEAWSTLLEPWAKD